MNLENTPSVPADFPVFIFAIAEFISTIVKRADIVDLFIVFRSANLVFVSFEDCLCDDSQNYLSI